MKRCLSDEPPILNIILCYNVYHLEDDSNNESYEKLRRMYQIFVQLPNENNLLNFIEDQLHVIKNNEVGLIGGGEIVTNIKNKTGRFGSHPSVEIHFGTPMNHLPITVEPLMLKIVLEKKIWIKKPTDDMGHKIGKHEDLQAQIKELKEKSKE
jgi:hypothetical protein